MRNIFQGYYFAPVWYYFIWIMICTFLFDWKNVLPNNIFCKSSIDCFPKIFLLLPNWYISTNLKLLLCFPPNEIIFIFYYFLFQTLNIFGLLAVCVISMVVIVPISSPKSSTVGFGLPIKLDLTLPMALPSMIGPLPEGKHIYYIIHRLYPPHMDGLIGWIGKKKNLK